MSEIFQHTERIKKEVTSKISETGNMVSQLKGEQENLRVETLNNLTSVQQVTQAAVSYKPSEVSLEDMDTMKRMFFEMKDNVRETDNYVR